MSQIFLLAGTSTFPDPGNWPATNTVEGIGQSGIGGPRIATSRGGGGGGGGAYAIATNLAPSFPVAVTIGSGTTVTASTSSLRTAFGALVVADHGLGRTATSGAGATAGGAGGLVANCTPTVGAFAGGNGFLPAAGTTNGGGGAGAGGLHGAGSSPVSTEGAAADSSNTASVAASTNGRNGTQWDATHGSGSGGGGSTVSGSTSGTGGAFGGGSGGRHGGAATTTVAGGAGLIVITGSSFNNASATKTLFALQSNSAATIAFTTYNIQPNLSAWASGNYTLNTRVSSGGNAYQCVVAGNSTSAPTGTSSYVNNGGTAWWKWLSAIDFTDFTGFNNAQPGTQTGNIRIYYWNNGTINCAANGNAIAYFGVAAGPYYTEIFCATSESFRDHPELALTFNTANGVSFTCPSSGAQTTNPGGAWVYINVNNVTIDGLQFIDPNTASNAHIFNLTGVNCNVRACLIDTSMTSTDTVRAIYLNGINTNVVNSLVIDRNSGGASPLHSLKWELGASGRAVGNTLISTTNTTTADAICGLDGAGQVIASNNAIFGYTTPFNSQNVAGCVVVDHCVVSAANLTNAFGSANTDGGGNLVSKTAANQFISSTNDFRLKSGADCIQAGAVDSQYLPTFDDIFRQQRQPAAWDVGVVDFARLASAAVTFDILRVAFVPPISFLILSSAATLTQYDLCRTSSSAIDPFSSDFSTDFGEDLGGVVFLTLRNVSVASQPSVSAAVTFDVLRAAGVQTSNTNATGLATFDTLGVSAFVSDWAFGRASFDALAAVATQSSFTNASASNTFDVLAVNATISDWAFGKASFDVLTAVATQTSNTNASAIDTFDVLAITSFVSDWAFGRTSFDVLSAVAAQTSSTNAVGLATFVVLSAVAAESSFTNASSTVSFDILSATGTQSSSTNVSAVDTFNILAVVATGTSNTNATGLASFDVLRAVGTQTSNTNATGLASFDVLAATGTEASFTNATATVTFDVLSAVATQTSNTNAVGLTSLDVLSAKASISDWAFGLASFNSLAAIGTQTSSTNASAVATFDSLSPTAFVSDWAYGVAALTFGAQGFVATAATSLVTFDVLNALAFAGGGVVAHGADALINLQSVAFISDWAYGLTGYTVTATGTQTSNTNAAGLASFDSLSAVGIESSSTNAIGQAVFDVLTAIGTQTGNINAAGLATFNSLTLSSFISDWVYGLATFDTLVANATQTSTTFASAADSFDTLSAAGAGILSIGVAGLVTFDVLNISASISDWATGRSDFAFTASGSVSSSTNTTTTSTFDVLSVNGTAQLQAIASCTVTLPLLGCIVTADQRDTASVTATFDIVARGTLGQFDLAQAAITIGISGSGVAQFGSGTPASAAIDIVPLSCVGKVVFFRLGVARQVWFDKDDRTVYWSPSTLRDQMSFWPMPVENGDTVYWPPSTACDRIIY